MTTTSGYIEALRDYKTEKAELYDIARIGIFGSVALNEQNADSDVNICVEPNRPNLFTHVHIKEDLQELFGRPVDIVHLRLDIDSVLHNNIIKDAVYA